MARERLYGWNGEMPAKEVGGQCAIVLRGMKNDSESLRTGHDWAERIGGELKTKQDPYRVVLYYILILKNKGCVRTNEYDINSTTKNGEIKHAITVKTQATVDEREVIVEPEKKEDAA
jgi:hypothetical protein